MRISARLGLTPLLAATLLAAAVGTASARNLSFSPQNMRATWSRFELVSSVLTVRCPLTIEGSFNSRTIAKVRGTLIGAITRAIVKREACTNGGLQAKNLPWHITYEAFTGTLPLITSIRLLLARFRFTLEFTGCEYGTATDNVVLSAQITALRMTEVTGLAPVVGANTANLVNEGFCSETATLVGPEGRVTELIGSGRLRITLI